MSDTRSRRFARMLALATFLLGSAAAGPALAQSTTSPTAPPVATPVAPASPATTPGSSNKNAVDPAKPTPSTATPSTKSPATPTAPDGKATTPPATPAPTTTAPDTATPEGKPLAPPSKPQNNEIEPNGSPGIPDNATTENVDVPARPFAMIKGQSSYDEAFKSIKTAIETVKGTMDKAGVKPSGHPITVFSEPDDKGFKFQAGFPIAAKPDKTDLGGGVTVATSPAGKAIKFQHRGAYDDIDSTYDVITAFLDAKGLQVDSPYIEEYLTDLTTSDDPNLQVDIYVFVK